MQAYFVASGTGGRVLSWLRRRNRMGVGAAAVMAGAMLCMPVASADTLEQALAYAYVNNPQINSQRAVVRATDEGVPTALAGYRPKVSVTPSIGYRLRQVPSADSFSSRFSGYRPSGRSEAPLAPSPAPAGFSFGTHCRLATCLPEQAPLPPCRLFTTKTPPSPAGSFL